MSWRLAVLAGVGVLLAGANARVGGTADPALRVMSFNVRLGVADDGANSWEHRKALLARTIQDFDPDREDTSSSRRALAGFSDDFITESFGISPDGRRMTLSTMERAQRLMLADGVSGVTRPR